MLLSPFSNYRMRTSVTASAVLLLLSACASTDVPAASVSEANSLVHNGYVLSAGDKVKITVFDEPSLTGEFQVGSGGELALPLIEPLPVAGRSPSDVAAEITSALADGGYVLEPRVSVEMLQYRPVYILGEVSNPGEYPYTGELTFLQAVAKAGGFTPRADKGRVVLQRAGTGDRLIELGESPLMVAPGDTLIVRQSFF
jgi:protein involved in polysaccharide export with SLBB domain